MVCGTYSYKKWNEDATLIIGHFFKEVDTRFSDGFVRSTVEFRKRKEDGQPFTLPRHLQTLSFYVAQFTRQISTVSTEQFGVGVRH